MLLVSWQPRSSTKVLDDHVLKVFYPVIYYTNLYRKIRRPNSDEISTTSTLRDNMSNQAAYGIVEEGKEAGVYAMLLLS